MNTRTETRFDLFLGILRHPLTCLVVLYVSMNYLRESGITYIVFPPKDPLQSFGIGALVVGHMLFVYAAFVYLVERRPVSELALPGMGRELGIGLLLGFGLMSAAHVIAMALGIYRIQGIAGWQNLIVGVSPAVFVVPVAEELMFRAVAFRLLENMFGGWVALVLSSMLFGLTHLMNDGETLAGIVAITFFAGPMLAVPFMLTRRLWMSIGLHLTWNYTMGKVYSGAVSGGEAFSGLFNATLEGPELLTGGVAGMEGSLIGMGVALTFTVVMLVLAARRGIIVPPPWKRTAVAAAQPG